MGNSNKTFGKLQISLVILFAISFSALPAQAKYGGGTGSLEDPYRIVNHEDLFALAEDANDYDKHFMMTADIDLDPNLPGRKVFTMAVIAPDINQTTYEYDGVPFDGSFDGNNFKILNLTIDGDGLFDYYLGLFGRTDTNCVIKNLGIEDVNITGSDRSDFLGGLVGGNCGTISNCYATGMVIGYYSIGGLVGHNIGIISDCNSTVSVTGYYSIGGLVGKNYGGISDCYATAPVTGIEYLGGLVGENSDSIDTCYAVGVVSGTDNSRFLGGLVGGNSGDINNCHATGSVIGDQYLGGLVGVNGVHGMSSSISGCYATGAVTGTDYLGGLVGLNKESISNSRATGEVTGIDFSRYIGGLVGYNAFGAPIISCSARGLVAGKEYLGGLVGFNAEGIIHKCYAAGAVSGSDNSYWLGGLVGYNKDSIRNCYATGAVTGGNDTWNLGGLVGMNNEGIISNCYAMGLVTGNKYLGGLVGMSYNGSISNCYAIGAVSGLIDVGGLLGIDYENESILTSCYFLDPNDGGGPDNGYGEPLTDAEMKQQASFIAWDFVDVWGICEGQDYPRLSWEKYGGGSGTANNPYLIYTSCQMNEIGTDANDWDKHFLLCADIDLSEYTGTEFNIIGVGHFECGFDLCWFVGTPFTGVFDGNSHTISNFTYEYSGDEFVGLFGCVDEESAQIKNLRLIDPNVDAGKDGVGSLVGYLEDGTITDCYVEGGSISGNHAVGGLIGTTGSTPQISNCHATGNILGTGWHVGGLVGANSGTISNCYSKASAMGVNGVGGLAGGNLGTITDCYVEDVSILGTGWGVGGLVGRNGSCIPEWRCFPGTISNCYSTGSVSGDGDVGGLVGLNEFGTITDSFWDTDISDVNNMCGSEGSGGSGCDNGNGKSTAQMQTESTFTDAGWDFVGETVNGPNDIWDICEGTNYPKLSLQITPMGDFGCPDGVNFLDFSFFAGRWAEENCGASNDCDGRDLNLLGTVDIKDLRIFADNWLAGF